jgi:dTDP-4-dehydrorhamnose reductase
VLDDNINMYCNLLENKSHFNKFINFGSGAELYMTDNFYGLSKFIIRNSILKQDNFYNIRIFGVFDENELDTRFIKSNIKKYINKESIIIHQDKIMDFFYMKDLISLVKYYIMNNNLSKEINCSYYKATTLFNIAEIINNLSYYKVPIILGDNNLGKNYREKYNLIINTIGLEQGIINTYNILK